MLNTLRALRTGALPLGVAFWGYAVLGSALTISLWLFSLGDPHNPSGVALLIGAPLCALYQGLVTLGVWRSAGRYRGDPRLAWAARGIMLAYAVCGILSYGSMIYIGLLFLGVMVHPPFIR